MNLAEIDLKLCFSNVSGSDRFLGSSSIVLFRTLTHGSSAEFLASTENALVPLFLKDALWVLTSSMVLISLGHPKSNSICPVWCEGNNQ